MVHCRPEGWAPPVAAADRLRVTVEPGKPVPELRGKETCCPLARAVIRLVRIKKAARRNQSLTLEIWSVLEEVCIRLTTTLLGRRAQVLYQFTSIEAGVFTLLFLYVSG
jgi:hypothetical protein